MPDIVNMLDYKQLKPKSNYFIYKYENIVTGGVYVGRTKQGLKRFRDHNLKLKNHKHRLPLQYAYDKYGSKSITIEIIDYPNLDKSDDEKMEELIYLEIYWIEFYIYNKRYHSYNIIKKTHELYKIKYACAVHNVTPYSVMLKCARRGYSLTDVSNLFGVKESTLNFEFELKNTNWEKILNKYYNPNINFNTTDSDYKFLEKFRKYNEENRRIVSKKEYYELLGIHDFQRKAEEEQRRTTGIRGLGLKRILSMEKDITLWSYWHEGIKKESEDLKEVYEHVISEGGKWEILDENVANKTMKNLE